MARDGTTLSGSDLLCMPAAGGDAAENAVAASPCAASLLALSRRIDWRFLMPDPCLGEVLYLGPEESDLVEALEQFSASVTAVDALQTPAANTARYDRVVLTRPTYDTLRAAAEAIRPGGYLYLEARTFHSGMGSRRRTGQPRLRFAADFTRAVGNLGFDCAESYWHWPSFRLCEEMVPLGDVGAMLHVFARRGKGPIARCKAAIGRMLVYVGLFSYLVPCFSVVARKKLEPEKGGVESCRALQFLPGRAGQ
ncbi:MAG: hypothetical protein HUU20_23750 [Pirellulales bacterium]|nr:hypothetical protein [Pirellulales bacterium]